MRHCRFNRHRRAAAAVEFAITFPFLLFLFIVAVDYGRVYQNLQLLSISARNGALYSTDVNIATDSPYDCVEDVVRASAPSLADFLDIQTNTTTDDMGKPCVDVTVRYPFSMVVAVPGVSQTMGLSCTARMRLPRAAQPDDQ